MEHRHTTFLKVVLLVSSIASLSLLAAAAYDENFRGQWREAQKVYGSLLMSSAPDENARLAAEDFVIEYKQLYLPELGEIDRCTTCHLGVENPAMAEADLPFRTHSAVLVQGDSLLAHHPTDKFGCTICHQGQGRAVSKDDAHGWHSDGSPVPHAATPLLRWNAVYTSCGRCHDELDINRIGNCGLGSADCGSDAPRANTPSHVLAYPSPDREGADQRSGMSLLTEGRRLVVQLGCLGCHKYQGRGGVLGPDITYFGDKTKHDFDFAHIKGEHTVEQWLIEHFMLPGEVSPGTLMPDMDLSLAKARSLSLYLLSLHRKTAPAELRPVVHSGWVSGQGSPGGTAFSGKTLYGMFCSACHGADGFGSTMRAGLWPPEVDPWGREWEAHDVVVERRDEFELPVPSLNHPDTLAVASDDYLRQIITGGRSGTNMLAWGAGEGGLTTGEIDRLVAHLRSWESAGPPTESISASRGNSRHGRALYRTRCLGCHGSRGQGGIGVALNSPSFLAAASDEFLRDTIIQGRANTAMPGWKHLRATEVSDLLAYLRTWESQPPGKEAVLARLASGGKPSRRALRIGKTIYRAGCSACHGRAGDGDIGPSLNTEEFLSLADDDYLFTAIVEGRPGTAMSAWKHLSADDLVDLINYIRTWNPSGRSHQRGLESFSAHGDWDRGRIIFKGACSGCHGKYAEGGTGPQLNNPVFLKSASDAMLREWIRYGKMGTPMLPFLKGKQGMVDLSESQVEDVVTYLRRFELRPRVVGARPGMGIVAVGAEVYAGVCAQCHGSSGEGVTGSALSNAAFLATASDGYLEATIVLGRDGTEMRAMGKGSQGNVEMSAEDIGNVVAFIRNWEWEPPSTRVARRYVIGADLAAGEDLFVGHCAGCHGVDGKSGWAPALNNREFLASATDGFLQATIAVGRSNTAMRAFATGAGGVADLSGDEIDNIVAYIRTWAASGDQPTSPVPQEEDQTQVAGLATGE